MFCKMMLIHDEILSKKNRSFIIYLLYYIDINMLIFYGQILDLLLYDCNKTIILNDTFVIYVDFMGKN
jgi:hypothetical protein